MTCIGCRTGQQQIRMALEPYALKKPVKFQTGKQNRLQTARYNRLTTGKANTPISYSSFRKKSIPTGTSQVQPTPQTEPIPPLIEPTTPVLEVTPQYYSYENTPNYLELFNMYSLLGGNLGWKYAALLAGEDAETIMNLGNIAKTQVGNKTFEYGYNPAQNTAQTTNKEYYTDPERQHQISYTDIPEQYRKNIKPILSDGGNVNYLKIFMNYGK